jgi:hypothetical protein
VYGQKTRRSTLDLKTRAIILSEIKENFYKSAAKPVVTLPVIQFLNDPEYRRDFGHWLYKNFDLLVDEYKTHGRFLTVKEIDNNPIEYSDLP